MNHTVRLYNFQLTRIRREREREKKILIRIDECYVARKYRWERVSRRRLLEYLLRHKRKTVEEG